LIKDEVTYASLGVAAFVTEEQIDHRTRDPQFRYKLYVLKYGDSNVQETKEDHAYEKREGSASIAIIDLKPDSITINTKNGKTTINI